MVIRWCAQAKALSAYGLNERWQVGRIDLAAQVLHVHVDQVVDGDEDKGDRRSLLEQARDAVDKPEMVPVQLRKAGKGRSIE